MLHRGRLPPAISCLGAFRTPAKQRGDSFVIPASENLHMSGSATWQSTALLNLEAAEVVSSPSRSPSHTRLRVASRTTRHDCGRRSAFRSASLGAEASRHGERRTSRHRDRKHALHPFVVGLHLAARDLARPRQIGVEGKQLRRRGDEEVVRSEETPHRLIPFRAHTGRRRNVVGRQLEPAFDLEDRFRLQERAFCRIVVIGQQRAAALPCAQPQPGVPDRIDRNNPAALPRRCIPSIRMS